MIFQQPVIAGDGNTYEWDAIRRYLNDHPPPCRGPLGTEIRASILYPNRALINILDEFRTSHRMAAMRPFHVEPAPSAPPPRSRPRPPAPVRPVMTVREASTMTLQVVVTKPAWLYELRKHTLLRICLLYTSDAADEEVV